MASVLTASGFKNLESLQDFSNRFPNASIYLDSRLEKIWVCHKNSKDIPACEDINLLPCEDYHYLSKKIKNEIVAGKRFYCFLTEFSAFSIFNEIYSQFKEQLTIYLFTKCFLFYNWGINAFEPLIGHFEIHSKILSRQKGSYKTEGKVIKYNIFNHSTFSETRKVNDESKEKEIDLFEEQSSFFKCKSTKVVNFRSVIKASKKREKFYDIFKNVNNPYQETFNLNKILYDIKQRPQWPRKHILCRRNVEDLILFIVRIPIIADKATESDLLNKYKNWFGLKKLLDKFIKNHEIINRSGGYERILKKHLGNVTTQCKGLHFIPKSSICSYLLDILRRVLPLELFGRNHLRKNFFSELIRVIKGNKNENFIWYPLLRLLLIEKSDLQWCSELGDNYTQSQVILKLFKFIVIHYVFIILKKNFYITETSSSGFGLRFFRKSDMERASTTCLNTLLENGNIRRLDAKDFDVSTVERNWLKTGNIAVQDLKKKLKKTVDSNSEYKQPAARVRFLPKSEGSDELRIITYIIRRASKCCNESSGFRKLEKYFKFRLSQRKKTLLFVKLFLEYLVEKIGFGIRPLPCSSKLERAWQKVVNLKEKYGKLFFVKADISDAFGSVKYDVLMQILKCALENEEKLRQVELMKIVEWKKKNGKIQKAVRLCFGNTPKENSVVISSSVVLPHNEKINWFLRVKFLEVIKQVVMQQELEIDGKNFILTKGLAQGSAGRFSTQLCEIYYSSMDALLFKAFIHSNDSVFLRGVDDYLFVTSDVEKAQKFLELVRSGSADYGVRFKSLKLKSNLIEDIHEVMYLGLIFNLENMSVRPNYSVYQQGDILSTINPVDKWGHKHFKKQVFLEKRLLHITCLKLHSIVVKGNHNLKTSRQIIFEACVVQSLRVLTFSNYLFTGSIKNDFAVYQILLMSCSKIKKLVTSSGVSTIEVNWLFFFATLNIVRKYSGQFKLLFLMVRFRLQKQEKEFFINGTELLLYFLKKDILDDRYWKKISEAFKALGKMPLEVS